MSAPLRAAAPAAPAATGPAPAAPGRLRVLLATPSLGVGGAERIVALLAHHLGRTGHDVGVVSMYDPLGTWIEAELRAAGVPLSFLGKRRGMDLRMVPRIAAAIRAFRPDVLHTHAYTLQYALPTLPLRPRLRVVHTLHNLAEREAHRPGRLVQGLAFRLGVAPVAIGEAMARSFRRVYGRAPRRVIPNGVPVAAFAPAPGAREAVRGELGLPARAPVVLAVSRLAPQKDVATLVRAFSSPRLAALDARLLVAGGGPLRAELEQLARDRNAGDRIRFLGIRTDVPRLLAAADLFALPSRYEGNPLTVMEAMAAGLPVVATAVGSVPELVPAAAGRLVPAGDEGALEDALHALLRDPVRIRALGAAAARVAAERFDAAAMAAAYAALYRELA